MGTRNSQKHRPNTGIDTCKQAGEESCRKVTAKQQISQPSLPSKQPRNQATRQIGTCRQPDQQPRHKKRASNATYTQRASQQNSQAARPPASKAATQAASQPDRSKNQHNRNAERHTGTAIHTAKQGLWWVNCIVVAHRFHKGILLINRWVRTATNAWQRRS